LGDVLSKIKGGYCFNWKGQKLIWPNGGRVPNVVFGFNPLPENLLKSLAI
jgi:hypothetical protein